MKGIALRAGLQWVSRSYGMSAVEAIYESGSPELRRIIVPGLSSFGIISSSWYPLEVVAELLETIDRVTAPNDLPAHRLGLAEAVAVDNLNGVYKSLFRLIASRQLFIAHSQRVWGSYFNEGQLVVTSQREGELVLSIHSTAHYDPICQMVGGFCEQVLSRIGFVGASLKRTRCKGKGASSCVFEVDYVL